MKLMKTAALVALAAAGLMAIATTASATSVTSPAGTTYTGTIKAEAKNGQLHGSFTTIQCGLVTVEGKIESHGAAVTAGGKVSNWSFSACNYPVTVKKAGSIELHTAGASSNGNGTLTSTGAEIAVHTSVGECVFTTNATDVGTVTGSNTSHATANANSAAIPRTGGSFFCGSSAILTGSGTVTTPSTLYVH